MIGFIGLGVVGQPMALNLARAGTPLVVWNRTAHKCEPLREAGAHVATTLPQVFESARIVILMLADEDAIDAVLQRGTESFTGNVSDRIIVHAGTTSPQYSQALDAAIQEAGGSYVESPVSGSRAPAERGELIAMLARDPRAVEEVRQLMRPLCRESVACGAVPNALLMKLAVNVFLVTMVSGLAESVHFAERHGLNMEQFRAVLNAGPMASSVSTIKVKKMIAGEYSVQAAVTDVLKNSRLMSDAARRSNVATPLLDASHALFGELVQLGYGHLDMAAVLLALRSRTERVSVSE